MPLWTVFMMASVMLGSICGNRLAGPRSLTTYLDLKNSAALHDGTEQLHRSYKSYAGGKQLEEDPPAAESINAPFRPFGESLESKLLRQLYPQAECGPNDGELPNTLQDVESGIIPERNSKRAMFAKSSASDNSGGLSELATLPTAPEPYLNDLYEDLLVDGSKQDVKRVGAAPIVGCDCKIKNDLLDLGQLHYPRYLLKAVCQTDQSAGESPQKCRRGSYCRPLDYKVNVLTWATVDHKLKDSALSLWLPDALRPFWKFKTVTVAAGCFCSY